MAPIKIFFFSGTGNSQKIAKDLGTKLKGELIPIKNLNSLPSITLHSEKIGIVFPAYYMRIPRIVERFLNKIENYENKYIFSVVTVAGVAGPILKRLSQIINSKNGSLAAGFIVRMPPNYIDVSDTLPEGMTNIILSKCSRKIDFIASYVQKSKSGRIESFNRIITFLFKGLIEKRFSKGLFEPADDQNFRVDANCTHCNICLQICPVNNISKCNDTLVWNGNCEKCLACINWCPQKAIQYLDVTKKRTRYHHPDISLQEMIDPNTK